MIKEIILLTKSSKRNGYCVAGIDAATGDWIRVVSDNAQTEHAVFEHHMMYANGRNANVFDIVQIDFIEKSATHIQPENWLFNESTVWKKVGESDMESVLALHPYETPTYIFYNNEKSLIDSDIDFSNHSSLQLVKVPFSSVFTRTFERKRYSYCFTYQGMQYQYISITDEAIKSKYVNKPDGAYRCRIDIPVVFSLADKHEGKYYKIAAQFLEGD